MGARVRVVLLAGVIAAMAVAISAVGGSGGGAVGALTPRDCIDDNDTGLDDCGQDTNGLDVPEGIAVSRDGKSVYVVSGEDDAIVRFNRQR